MQKLSLKEALPKVIKIARDAGELIMHVYHSDFVHSNKKDSSPITEADLAAHRAIVDGLKKISDLPILSEESDPQSLSWNQRKQWHRYWLIDPLDGTKEFIHKNDEFTVNIALIDNHTPVLGVVYCPALNLLYFAAKNHGAYKTLANGTTHKISVTQSPSTNHAWKIVGSRRHGETNLQAFSKNLPHVELVSMGSSLKLCLVAEGKAHLYPRLAPTCEWDTAAAQAVVENAGGQVLTKELTPLKYGCKEELLNPYFIACNEINNLWEKPFQHLCD